MRRYPLWRWPGRRYLLKALSLVPLRRLQRVALPCNPISWRMSRDAKRSAEAFDVVHATAFPYTWPIVCGLRLARRLGVPFLLTPFLHLGDPDDPLDRTRRAYTSPPLVTLLREADAVFAQTASERDELLRLGVRADRIVLQGLGVEFTECTGGNRAAARRAWGAEDGEVVIGHLANNSEEKGTVDLLRAAEKLWDGGRRFRVVLAGPEMPNFRAFWDGFAAGRPGAAVLRLGAFDDREKCDFFAGLDVFALPSRSDSFGLVLLEAWANALPNVAYRAGGVTDVVRHGADGLLARCGDVDGLAAELSRLIDDIELRKRLGAAGRERSARDFRWEDKLEVVRKEALGRCREPSGTSQRDPDAGPARLAGPT